MRENMEQAIIIPIMSGDKKQRELKEFSDRLISLCNKAGLPAHGRQSHIARELGLDPSAVKKWFWGQGYPSMTHAKVLCRMLGCQVNWLMSGTGPERGIDNLETLVQIVIAIGDELHAAGRANWSRADKAEFILRALPMFTTADDVTLARVAALIDFRS